MPLESLIEFITTLMTDYLYAGVFLAALIETIIPPIPTMAVFPTAGFIASQNGLSVVEAIFLGIVGGLGASIGSTIIYLIALMVFLTLYFFNNKLKCSPRSSKFLKLSKEAADGLNKTVLCKSSLLLFISFKTCLTALLRSLKQQYDSLFLNCLIKKFLFFPKI